MLGVLGAIPLLGAVGWMVGLDWCFVSLELVLERLGVNE
jgi:hypothetical protein